MAEIKALILDYIYSETGLGKTPREQCEVEELTVMHIKDLGDGSSEVSFEYMFNEDKFSLVDKSHLFVGQVVINRSGQLLEKQLEETYTGSGCQRKFSAQ